MSDDSKSCNGWGYRPVKRGGEKMKRKIISKISYGYVVISAIAAPWMAFADLRLLPTCIWGIGLMIATAGMFLTEHFEKVEVFELKEEVKTNARKRKQDN